MNDKLELIRTSGETINADLICFFENTQNNKRYVYFTLNEIVGSGPSATVKIYVGKAKQNDVNLDAPINDADWEYLKGVMGEVLKGTANPSIKYLNISALTDKTLISEKVIAMPTTYDYINKHRDLYNSSISSESSSEVLTPVVETPQVTPADTPVVSAEPTPVVETPIEPIIPSVQVPVEPVVVTPSEPTVNEVVESTNANMMPINIENIERKYQEMAESLNKLKEQEIEAAKRYNATLELSSMHNEQHAEYVANEQSKEVAAVEPAPVIDVPTEPVSMPVEPAMGTPVAPIVEPTPIEPTPVIPSALIANNSIETNWFDMPNQG